MVTHQLKNNTAILSTESDYNPQTNNCRTSWLCSKEFCSKGVSQKDHVGFTEIMKFTRLAKTISQSSLPFSLSKFRQKLKFNPTHLPTKISGTPNIPCVEMKHPFSKSPIFFSLRIPFVPLDFSRMKNDPFSQGFFEANPVWFHLTVSIKMDKSKAAMKMPER